MKKHGYYVLIALITFALLIPLFMALTHQFSQSDEAGVGLRKANQTRANVKTAEEIAAAYAAREELPEVIASALDATILSGLSAGDFERLDKKLREYQETYKENADDADSEMGIIDDYRADLAYYSNITSGKPVSPWLFRQSDVLAAAIAYAPISSKYDAFIDQRSALTVPARGAIALSRSGKTNGELQDMLDSINRSRTRSGAFRMIAVYDLKINGRECEFIAVSDDTTLMWQPYSLTFNDGDNSPSVMTARQILRQNSNTDLDAVFVAPQANE